MPLNLVESQRAARRTLRGEQLMLSFGVAERPSPKKPDRLNHLTIPMIKRIEVMKEPQDLFRSAVFAGAYATVMVNMGWGTPYPDTVFSLEISLRILTGDRVDRSCCGCSVAFGGMVITTAHDPQTLGRITRDGFTPLSI
jgi:hypothetical protein